MILAMALAAPAARADLPGWKWEPPKAIDWIMLSAAEGLIFVDVLQTHECLTRNTCHEGNPLIGRHPSKLKLDLLAAGGAALTAAIWYKAPPKIRWLVPLVVGSIEATIVFQSAAAGVSMRF